MSRNVEPHLWIRGALLLALPVLAYLVWIRGQDFDPGLLDFSRPGTGGGVTVDFSWIPKQMPPFTRLGALRHYTRENLFEYVNGHAESYLDAGFVGLVVAEYGHPEKEHQPQVTIDIFDMGKPLQAFGLLMNETPANVKAVAVGAMGFDYGQGINFIQGQFFIKMTTFTPQVSMETWAGDWALPLIEKTGKAALDLGFPTLGNVVQTRFIKQNYRGMAFLNNVIERTFKRTEIVFQSFLLTGSPEELQQRKQSLMEFLAKEKIPTTFVSDVAVPHILVHDPYEGDWFLVEHGSRILGVFGIAIDRLEQPLREFIAP